MRVGALLLIFVVAIAVFAFRLVGIFTIFLIFIGGFLGICLRLL
jgi:hypothetical protein